MGPPPKKDLEAVRELAFVVEAELEELSLTLTVANDDGTEERSAMVVLPEEYPNGEPAILGDEYVALQPGRLVDIAAQVHARFFGRGRAGGRADMDEDADEEEEDDDFEHTPSQGFGHCESTGFGTSGEISEQFTEDIDAFADKFGKHAYELHDFRRIDSLQVDLKINVGGLLANLVCDAWGVDPKLPIVIKLHLSRSHYLDQADPPKVECYQIGRKCPLAGQLQNILTSFVRLVWGKREAELERIYANQGPAPRASRPPTATGAGAGTVAVGPRPPSPTSPSPGGLASFFKSGSKGKRKRKGDAAAQEAPALEQLLGMGFDKRLAELALAQSHGEVAGATELLTNPDWMESASESVDTARSADMDVLAGAAEGALIDPERDPRKAIPRRTQGFLNQVADYALHRLPTCSNFCVICDKTHMFGSGAMLKPAVCSRELCAFAFQQLKVGANAAEEIATEAGVVDLLVCMAKAAAHSGRAELIFDPYPQVVDPENPKKMALSPEHKDMARIKSILSAFPPVKQLSQADDILAMKARLDQQERLAYPLLQWIVSSNRSHIVKLRPDMHLHHLATPHQYLLVTAPPEKQARFNQLKKQHGTKFAFHGSPIENWHNIMRNGLRNASGTNLQLHGTAHGSGIYLATTASTSFGYCGQGGGFQRQGRKGGAGGGADDGGAGGADELAGKFIDESKMFCLALCEVINHEINDCGWCWVVPKPENVVTRFFFVYDSQHGQEKAHGADTKSADLDREIRAALQKHNIH